MSLRSLANCAVRAALAVAVVALAGCSMDDVQLNGKIFDAVGINNTGSVKKEATLRERSPLVVPPGLENLPEPGSAGATQAAGIAEIKDYDASKQTTKADLQRKQDEYCKVHYEQAKAHGDNDADSAAGPLGPCRGSVFTAIKNWNESDQDEDAQ